LRRTNEVETAETFDERFDARHGTGRVIEFSTEKSAGLIDEAATADCPIDQSQSPAGVRMVTHL